MAKMRDLCWFFWLDGRKESFLYYGSVFRVLEVGEMVLGVGCVCSFKLM